MLEGLFYGTITDIHPPNHKDNKSKAQYEYRVLITHQNYSQIPVYAIKMDSSGSAHNFTDEIGAVGNRVLIMFPRGEPHGIIIGGLRSCSKKIVDSNEKYFYRKRFNEIENYIDFQGSWHVKSDDGPNMNLTKKTIVLDDSMGEKITLDKEAKTLTVETKELVIIVKGNAKITVEQNVDCEVKGNVTAKVQGNVEANIQGNLTGKINGEAKLDVSNDTKVTTKNADVTAKGTVRVMATQIELNGNAGGILTDKNNSVVDYITGIPSVPVPNVRSGA